jgi:lipopolysaccharide transport system permease protein
VIIRGPTLIARTHPSGASFPLELLPVIAIGSALFHLRSADDLARLHRDPGLARLSCLFPIVVLPLTLLTRLNVGAPRSESTCATSPTRPGDRDRCREPGLYPPDADSPFREFVMLSPLTLPIVMARDVLLWGHLPDAADYATYSICALAVAWLGFAWFQATRKGFADVL